MKDSLVPLHFDMEISDVEEENLPKRSDSIKSIKFSENISLLLNAIGVIIAAISQFHFKYTKLRYPNDYEEYSYCFWRYFWSFIIIAIFRYFTGKKLMSCSILKSNPWFWVRSIDQFFVFETLLFLISFFRVSTATCFVSMAPVVILIMSSFLLGEKFYIRYIYGIAICFFGVVLIVTNENHQSSGQKEETSLDAWTLFMGSFWGIVQLTTVALHRVSSKLLVKVKVDENAQIMYPSIACCVLPIISIILLGRKFSYGFWFVFNCGFNGLLWILFTRLLVISLRGVDLIKTTAIGYLSVLTVFLLSSLFLGETIYFTDLLGSLCILGYNVWNTLYPPHD